MFNGYRDVLLNVAVRVEGDVSHLCELQIHHAPIKESEPMHKSHVARRRTIRRYISPRRAARNGIRHCSLSQVTYEFFREYFLGNAEAVETRLEMLCALPVADAEDVDDMVDRMLGSDATLLFALAEWLHAIAEHASAVRVWEHLLPIQEREYQAAWTSHQDQRWLPP